MPLINFREAHQVSMQATAAATPLKPGGNILLIITIIIIINIIIIIIIITII